MNTSEQNAITVETTVKAPLKKVWDCWTQPKHIIHWNFASDDWHCPSAENDLQVGGKFSNRMEAREGSVGFDFSGVYTKVDELKVIAYTMDDGRKTKITFTGKGAETTVAETFDAEKTHSVEMQREGWQAIINNFKKYVEWLSEFAKLSFEIEINAPVDVVYKKMIEDKYYREWTAAFNPGSYFKGSWDKGSKILFIGTDEKGNEGGMVSRIKENIPYEFISIEHIGLLHGDKEITTGSEIDGWAGALENYSFVKQNGSTKLIVELDANNEFSDYFNETWPKALAILKSICESN